VDLAIDLEAARQVLRQHGVVFAIVFGSHAEGRARPGSDVDLAVWGTRPLDEWALRARLPDEVDLVDLRRTPEVLAGRIACSGVVVLDDDPPQRIRWQAETRKRYLDEEARRRRFRADFAAAHGRP
jgi:predicted nucleotidyltransferase